MGLQSMDPPPGQDPLQEKAETLVQAAQVMAMSMFLPTLDRFPFLERVDGQHWNFVVAVAGVYVASTGLGKLSLPDVRGNALTDCVAQGLTKWDPDGPRAFVDCQGFFEKGVENLSAGGHDPQWIASDALGTWIVWNVLGKAPETDQESQLARTTGLVVIRNFRDWWDS